MMKPARWFTALLLLSSLTISGCALQEASEFEVVNYPGDDDCLLIVKRDGDGVKLYCLTGEESCRNKETGRYEKCK